MFTVTNERTRGSHQVRISALVAICAFTVVCMSVTATEAADAQAISETEAQILIYVSPFAEKLRAEGLDVALDQETSDKLNQADYYYFWVYDSKRQSNGSVTIGHFAVNKHTAEVWDTTADKELSGKPLSGTQSLIRRSNHISADTIKKYTSRPR
jgi:hypothetical protein